MKKLSTVLIFAASLALVGCNKSDESSLLDQHVCFLDTFRVDGKTISLNIQSMYDIHHIKYQYTLFGKNQKLIGIYQEEQDVSISKNKNYSLQCQAELQEEVTTVRFSVLDAKTYDEVDNTKIIKNKVYYYDYLSLFNQNFKLQNTEKVSPKKFPKATFSAAQMGAYKFSYWSTDLYGNEVFSFTESLATKNMLLYPNYEYSENTYKEILQQENIFNSQFVINRTFEDDSTLENKTITGYGTVYHKASSNEFWGITTLSFLKKELEGCTSVSDSIHIRNDDYDFSVMREIPEYNLVTIKFEPESSSKRYVGNELSASSFINSKTDAIGIIEAPYADVRKETTSFVGKYLGHAEIEGKDYLKYQCEIGEDMEGCAIYDCKGNIAGINTDMNENGVGYAIPSDVIRTALEIIF